MATERRPERVKEFQLEGLGLVLVGTVVVVALLGAFMAGRWYERQQQPDVGARVPSTGDPLAHVELPEAVVDVADTASFFDIADGGQKQAEPSREVRRDSLEPVPPRPVPAQPGPSQPGPSQPERTPAPSAAAPRAVAGGEFYVQVFAGRDEKAASGLLDKLEAAGHSARLHTERQGSTTLYKVRVGGFDTQDRAREAADRLQAEGYAGAWVTRADPAS